MCAHKRNPLSPFSELNMSNFSGIQVHPPVSAGASRIAAVYAADGASRLSWTQPFAKVIWEPSSVDASNTGRLTLALQPDEELANLYDALDATFLKLATENSVKLFGKQLTPEQIALSYTSPMRRSTRGTHIRAKLVPPGNKYPTRNWSEDKEPLPWPTGSWVGQECKAFITLSSIWIAAGRWGLTLSATDIILRQIEEEETEAPPCPF
jgi:hypothetical protein